jgi:cation transport regulator ChaB
MIRASFAKLRAFFAAVFMLLGAVQISFAEGEAYEQLLNEIVAGPIAVVVSQKPLLSAIVSQNQRNADLSQQEIDALDTQWRTELKAKEQPLIHEMLNRELSAYLKQIQENSGGVITEIIVMDAYGLNVAQSALSSDYWQGDEDKWQVPFVRKRIHISALEFDESTNMIQTQISVPVRDSQNKIVGVATFGVHFKP